MSKTTQDPARLDDAALDCEIAEKVMGWTRRDIYWFEGDRSICCVVDWNPSTDPTASRWLTKRIEEMKRSWEVHTSHPNDPYRYIAYVGSTWGMADTPERALAIAALKAVTV